MKRFKKFPAAFILALVIALAAPIVLPANLGSLAAQAATVKINAKKKTLKVGMTYRLKVTGTKKDIVWKSSKPSVAKVSRKGLVTAKSVGRTNVTAKVGSKKLVCKITVKADKPGGDTLIAYFSRAGENYEVGVVDKGNTRIIAEMIAEETGADLFEIQAKTPYPDTYDECTDVAKQEQDDNVRPKIVDPPESLDGYDTVFIGYPIWWGDLPMAVYTFLESYDFSGKTVIPFCTHGGSGLAGTEGSIEDACPGATVLDGLAIRGSTAQNEQEEAKADVLEWLDGLGR